MSLQQGGNSNLFVMDLRSKTTTRLTDTPAIDTSPSYARMAARSVSNPTAAESPQIYVMPAGGGGAQRISFGDGSYSTPVWSPRVTILRSPSRRRPVCDRHHEDRRLGRAHPDLRLPQRRADIRAEGRS